MGCTLSLASERSETIDEHNLEFSSGLAFARFSEFGTRILEVMRQFMEDKVIIGSRPKRSGSSASYPKRRKA